MKCNGRECFRVEACRRYAAGADGDASSFGLDPDSQTCRSFSVRSWGGDIDAAVAITRAEGHDVWVEPGATNYEDALYAVGVVRHDPVPTDVDLGPGATDIDMTIVAVPLLEPAETMTRLVSIMKEVREKAEGAT